MTFLHKRIGRGDGFFGADLRDLRESRDRSLAEVAKETRIHEAILVAFEEDRLEDVEDPAFAERHLRAYVRALGGHEPYFVARYRQRMHALQAERKPYEFVPRTRGVRRMDLFVGSHVLTIVGVLALAALLGGYVVWQAALVRTPPTLTIISPQEGEVLKGPVAHIQGATMSEAVVTVNGRTAPVDPSGTFSLSIDVRRGTTALTIIARRRRGSETRVTRNVIYDTALLNADAGIYASSTPPTSATSTTSATQ